MATERDERDNPYRWEQEAVYIEADALALRRGLDAERVRAVFDRMWAAGCLFPDFPRNTALDEAFAVLGPEDALRLFEQEDLGRLARRLASCLYLGDPLTPFYTLDELADLGDGFVAHLERNRASLIETGHAGTSFGPSRWFDWRMGKLYHVKLPVIYPFAEGLASSPGAHLLDSQLMRTIFRYSTRIRVEEDGGIAYEYVWAKQPPEFCPPPFTGGGFGFRWGKKQAVTPDGKPVTRCSYQEGALIPGMAPADAERLAGMRRRFLDLELAVLRRLSRAARARDARNLWSDCLKLVTDSLLGEEAEFLLNADRFYHETGAGVKGVFYFNTGEVVRPSIGFSGLLDTIGHYENEIEIGVMHQTRAAFRGLPGLALPLGYYQAATTPWRDEIDAALDRLPELGEKGTLYTEAFVARVNGAIETEFCDEFAAHTKVPRRLKTRFEAFMRTVTEYMEATGRLPDMSLSVACLDASQPPPAPSREPASGGAPPTWRDLVGAAALWRCYWWAVRVWGLSAAWTEDTAEQVHTFADALADQWEEELDASGWTLHVEGILSGGEGGTIEGWFCAVLPVLEALRVGPPPETAGAICENAARGLHRRLSEASNRLGAMLGLSRGLVLATAPALPSFRETLDHWWRRWCALDQRFMQHVDAAWEHLGAGAKDGEDAAPAWVPELRAIWARRSEAARGARVEAELPAEATPSPSSAPMTAGRQKADAGHARAFTREELAILFAVNEEGALLTVAEISDKATRLDRRARCGEKTTGKLVTSLIARGYLVRPTGDRGGVGITQKGIDAVAALPKKPAD